MMEALIASVTLGFLLAALCAVIIKIIKAHR